MLTNFSYAVMLTQVHFPLLDGNGISPDDFHWHCHAGRAMGHMVDLQNNTFSSGKILLGSYMKKPTQMDLNAVTVSGVCVSPILGLFSKTCLNNTTIVMNVNVHKEYVIRGDDAFHQI